MRSLSQRVPTSWRPSAMLRPLCVVTSYLVLWTILDFVAMEFSITSEASVWYPPVGLSVVLLFVFGLRYWPALLLTAPISQFLVSGEESNALRLLIFEFVTTAAYVLPIAFLLRKLRINPRLTHLRDVIWFVGVLCLAAPLLVALLQGLQLSSAQLSSAQLSPFNLPDIVLGYWAGDATGIGMLAPFLLVVLRRFPSLWVDQPQEPEELHTRMTPPSREELPELLAQAVVLAVAIWGAFGAGNAQNLEYSYFIFLPVIWIAVRNGFERTTLMVLLINTGVVLLVGLNSNEVQEEIALQFSLMTMTISGLILGAVVTGRRQTVTRLRYNASHDALTGLLNRTSLLEQLDEALLNLEEQIGRRVAVLFLDLDNFKDVNDSLGHEIGDELLAQAANRLSSCLRSADTAARFGGDEFVILLEGRESQEEVNHVATRILSNLSEPYHLKGYEVQKTASMGVVQAKDGAGRAEDLLSDADAALMQAKSKGRARYVVFDDSLHQQTQRRLQLKGELYKAVERDEFELCYQPIFSLNEDRIAGFEALVRWPHPERGLLAPREFVPLAEQTGLIVPIGKQVLREACQQALEWQQEYSTDRPIMISVNLSVKHFQQPGLKEDIHRILRQTGLAASCLLLEITESVLMEDSNSTNDALKGLKGLGVWLAVDDFGVGYSSLSYLKRYPLDVLKIDRSFIGGPGEDSADKNIILRIVQLAHDLGLQAIAEGVETAEQLSHLRHVGCDMAQGYHLQEPLTRESASKILASYSS